ncbi:hypothetical protein [Aeromonas sp. FDAARGOS 1406]|uniref:phage head spike fiber domain-containing protein n=1 Tax=Aeromonas sp. FDAARGOS 1406 TaxID=2778055 RepID=UPI001C219AE6|nr:hypothetical protein [Aeromonas sp. FDAARGOS 1406]QXB96476.1 hypothetical protein I6L36_06255 [Aeromonas sp. FDAARGOS 1406]
MAGVWKRDGTVAVTNGNKKVTGTGTTFADTKNGVAKGHLFCITSGTSVDFYEVDYVVSNTELYLVQAYRGTTATGKAYEIITTFSDSVPEFARRLTATLSAYQQQSDAFQALLTSTATTVEVTAPDGTKQTLIPWKRVTSEGEGQAARAKTEADKAAASAALAGDIVAASALPLPDVWAPLSDSLRLITGYGRDVLVGSDVVARMVNFARSSTATYIGKDGLLKTAAANEPRFEKEGLLVEGQSTNIVTNSNVFTPYGAGATKVDNQPGPFGANDATRIDTVNPYQGTNPPLSASLVDGSVYTSSVWLRGAVGGEKIRIGIHNSTTGLQVTLTTEWKRYSITQTRNAGTNAAFVIQAESAPVSFFVYGAQLEALPFASSYIPTAGAAVTRAADVCWIPMAGNSDNRMSFALAISGFKSVGPGITSRALWYEFDMSGPYFGARYRDGEILAAHGMSPAGATIYSTGLSGFPAATIAISPGIKSRFGQYTATQKVDSSPLKTSPGNLHIGSFKTPGQELWGHVRNLRIWHRVLTEEQIKAVA